MREKKKFLKQFENFDFKNSSCFCLLNYVFFSYRTMYALYLLGIKENYL